MQAETLPQPEAEPPVLSDGEYVFVFTDIADSTRLTFTLPPAVWGPARDRFFALQSHLARENGLLWLSPRGDGKFLVFSRPEDAVRFAAALLPAINSMDWNGVPMAVRVGIAAGFAEWLLTEGGGVQDDFVGTPLNLAARICGAARPGEVLTAAQISQCREALSNQITFADLGEVELKGLPPERVFRVVAPGLAQDFPPLAGRGNLDEFRAYSAYFGRDDTIAEALEALRGKQPVLTILGDPGLGKTRLSLETGQQARDSFTDGVWFAPLEQVRQGALVAEAVAVALGVAPQAGRPIGDVLREFLRPRHALLILDNCEQLLMDEDDLELLDFIEATVRSCPKLRVLATSRQPLELGPGLERMQRIRDLPVPPEDVGSDPAVLRAFPSVNLLCDRMHLASGGQFVFDAASAPFVASICRSLDGVPLYLELAAGQLARACTLPQIASDVYNMLQTRDRGYADRQRTLDKLLDFSCDHLPDERDFFYKLGVFAGPFRAEDARAVTGESDAEELLRTLVLRSLVKSDSQENYLAAAPRFRLLQAPAAYGRKHLGDALADWQRRHAAHYLAFARARDGQLKGPQQKEAGDALAENRSNLRAGMDWARAESADDLTASYGEALGRFLFTRGLTEEGRERIGAALEAARRTGDRRGEACALSWSATFERQRGSAAAARNLGEEALSLWRALGDKHGEAASLNALAIVAATAEDKRARHEEALALFREIGDLWGEALCLNHLGALALRQGHIAPAQELLQSALRLRAQIGDLRGQGESLAHLGSLAFEHSDYDRAQEDFERALALRRTLEDRVGEAWGVYMLATVAQHRGDSAQARPLFETALAAAQRLGLQWLEGECRSRTARLLLESGEGEAARRQADLALARFRAVENREGEAQALVTLGEAAYLENHLTEAGDLVGQALTLWEEHGSAANVASCLFRLGMIAQKQGETRAARRYFARSLPMLQEQGSRHGVAMTLGILGEMARQAGEPSIAYPLLRAARAVFAALGLTLEQQDVHDTEQSLSQLNAAPAQAAAWETQWGTISADEAAAVALAWAEERRAPAA